MRAAAALAGLAFLSLSPLGAFATAQEAIPICHVTPAQGTAARCIGDCDGDGSVTADEIVGLAGIIAGGRPYSDCPLADRSRDGQLTIDELIASVDQSLRGCPVSPPPAPSLPCPDGEPVCNVAAAVGLVDLSFGKGAAFVDLDGDDFDDIWAADSDQRLEESFGVSMAYRNLGDGTFAPLDLGLADDALRYNWAGSFADVDNDGDPDLLLVNGGFSGEDYLHFFRNDLRTSGRFTEVTESMGITTDRANWWGASWADFDGDGWLDVVVTPRDGRLWLYRNLGGSRFEDVTAAVGIDDSESRSNAHNPVWFDYDADGDPDLYLAGLVEAFLYRNDGPQGFADVSDLVAIPGIEVPPIPIPLPFVFAAAAEDLNQDGFDDLYLGRWSYQDYVLLNRGDGTFARMGAEVGLDMALGDALQFGLTDPGGGENTMGLALGDFDEDGRPDIFIGTGNPAFRFPDLVFCNESSDAGNVSFVRCGDFVATGHGPSQTHGIALGDPDRDGDTDIFYSIGGMSTANNLPPAPGSRSANAFYRRQPAGAVNTAVIRLEGTRSNRDAIGATIRVDADRTHYYTVRSTQGFQSQNAAWMVLALGDASYGTASIRWPSGEACKVRLFAGDRLRVTE